MAFASSVLAIVPSTSRSLKLDGYGAEVHVFTKSSGDTTATVFADKLRRIISVAVFGSNGTVISTGQTIDNTVGQSGHESVGSVALTSLGSGTSGAIVIKGSRQ